MVAIVSGNGLGLYNTSLTNLGLGLGGSAGIGQSSTRQYVNLATGNLMLQSMDESMLVRGFDTAFVRTYNSSGTVAGMGQDGFQTGYERRITALTGTLNAVNSTISLESGDGQVTVFTWSATLGRYQSTDGDGAHDTLTWNGTTREWTYTEGSSRREELFADHASGTLLGRLIRIRNPLSDGTTPAQFDVIYDASNRVSEVRSVDGSGTSADAIIFTYGTSNRLTSVTTRENSVVLNQLTYGYDAQGRLIEIITDLTPGDATGAWSATASANNELRFRTAYTYMSTTASDLRIASVTTSDGVTVSYTYDSSNRIQTVTQGSGAAAQVLTFAYDAANNATNVTDGNGKVWTYQYDANKRLTAVLEPADGQGVRTGTYYSYDPAGNVTQIRRERASVVLSQTDTAYDSFGNVIAQWSRVNGANPSSTLLTRAYSNTTDPTNSNPNLLTSETRYTGLDADGTAGVSGGASATGAATTRYVYDGNSRLRFVVDAQGGVHEYQFTSAGNGIGQLYVERQYLAAYTGDVTINDLNAWATGAQKGNSTLKMYQYDAKGRLSQIARFGTVNATTGGGIFDDGTIITNFAYDAQGLLRTRIDVRGTRTSLNITPSSVSEVIDYVYDGMGRLLATQRRAYGTSATAPALTGIPATDAANLATWDAATVRTTTLYLDSSSQIQVTSDAGAVATETRNSAGLVSTQIETGGSVNRTTRRFYDANGNLRALQDGGGARTYWFYDASGRMTSQVDATGAVTEFVRDVGGQVIDTITYSQRIDTSTWITGASGSEALTATTLAMTVARPVAWSTSFDTLPISGFHTTFVNNPANGNIVTHTAGSGRLTFTPVTGNYVGHVQRTVTRTLAEGIGLTGEVTTSAAQDNTYLLFSLQNMGAGAAVRRSGVFFHNGKIYAHHVVGSSTSNVEIGTTAANTTYVVETRARDGQTEYTVYVKGTDPDNGIRFSLVTDSADWGATRFVAFGAGNQPGGGDPLYLDSLAETDLGARHAARTYDALGRLLTQTDSAGLTTTYEYDGLSQLTRAFVSGAGVTSRVARYFHDSVGRVVGTLDPAGYFTESVYDVGGRLVRTVRHDSPVTGTTFASGTFAQVQVAAGAIGTNDQVTRYYYDRADRCIATVNAEGYLTEFSYDEKNNQRATSVYGTKITASPTGSETIAQLRTWGGAARVTLRSFDSFGRVSVELNPEGTATTYTYDEAGRLVTTSTVDATTLERREVNRRYDVFGNVSAELGGEGSELLVAGMTQAQIDLVWAQNATLHSYDTLGRRSESTDALGNKVWYFHDNAGRVTHTVRGIASTTIPPVLNATAEVTEVRYSAFGEVVDSISYGTRFTLATPDRAGAAGAISALSFTAGADRRRQATFDERGLLRRNVDSLGVVSAFRYTLFGQIYQEQRHVGTSAEVTVQHAYDLRGLETQRKEALGTARERTLARTYDAFGRLVTSTDWRNTLTTFTYDRLGRQVARSRTIGGRVEDFGTTYDAWDRVATQTDARGNVTTYAYSDANRTVTVTTPEGVSVTTKHNGFGQTTAVTTSAGTTTYTYNDDGHLLTTTPSGLAASTNRYDVLGRLFETEDATGRVVRYSYDAAGRVLTRIEDPNVAGGPAELNLVTTYAYDALGNQLSITDASGRVTVMSYDSEGRVLTITRDPTDADAGIEVNQVTTYTYDAAGRRLTVTEGTGTARHVVAYAYDELGRRISETVDPTGLALHTTFGYDANDNVTFRNAGGAITRYWYDDADRLVVTVDPAGGYTRNWFDANGRITATRRFSAPINTSTVTGTESIATMDSKVSWTGGSDVGDYRCYDADGRLVYVLDTSGRVTQMAYDDNNRLVSTRRHNTLATIPTAQLNGFFQGTILEADVSAIVSINIASEMVTYTVFDAAGRARFTVTGHGTASATVVETRYDAADRVLQSVAYPSALVDTLLVGGVSLLGKIRAGTATVTDMATFATTANQNLAQRQMFVFDGAGRQRFSVNALFHVTETLYDGAGRMVGTRTYANPLADTNLQTALRADTAVYQTMVSAMAALADGERDLQLYSVYDGAGRVAYRFDGAGNLSRMSYTVAGLLRETVVYGTALDLDASGLRGPLAAGTVTAAAVDALVTAGNYSEARASYSVYDLAGRVLYQVSRATSGALVTGYTYDANGRVLSTTIFGKAISTYAATATQAQVESWLASAGATDPASNRVTRYVYDAVGQVRFTIDDAGAVTEQVYNGVGYVVETRVYGKTIALPVTLTVSALQTAIAGITDVRVTSYTYTHNGRLFKVTDGLASDGAAANESYYYDGCGRQIQRVDRMGAIWLTAYDGAGRVVTETSPSVTTYRFDAAGNLQAVSGSIVTSIEYDGLGNVTARTENAGASVAADRRRTEYVYDLAGRQVTTRFPVAGVLNTATNVFDDSGTGPTTTVTYNALGQAVVQLDVRGNRSYRVYDELGRLAYEVDAEGYVTGYEYNAYGETTSLRRYASKITLALTASEITQAQIEAAGVLSPSTTLDRIITTAYDRQGRRTSITETPVSYINAAGTQTSGGIPTTTFTYDAYGNLVKESVLVSGTAALGTWVDSYRYYDQLGREIMTVDAEGYVTRREYDARGQVTRVIEYARAIGTSQLTTASPPLAPMGGDAAVGYDRVTLYAYDALGRKSSEMTRRTYAMASGVTGQRNVVTTYGYDKAGRMTSSIVDGATTTITYDSLGRQATVREPERDVLRWDSAGADFAEAQLLGSTGVNLTSAALYERASPYTTTSYDAFGNVVRLRRYADGYVNGSAVVNPARDQVTTTRYDRQGRAVMIDNNLGKKTYQKYDAGDNVLEQWYDLGGSSAAKNALVRSYFSYDKNGQQIHSRLERTVGTDTGIDRQQFASYNAFGEVVSQALKFEDLGVAGKSLQFNYDAAGRLVSSNQDGGALRYFHYNLAGAQVRERRYHVSSVANNTPTTVEVTYNSAVDRLGRVIRTDLPAHNAAGTTSSVSKVLDRWGNVLRETDPRGFMTRREYNEQNQCTREVGAAMQVVATNGQALWRQPETRWMYDAMGRLVATRDANGNVRENVYNEAGELVRAVDGTGAVTRQAYDALGNNRLTQNALGYITYREFDSVGRVTGNGDYLPSSTGGTRAKKALQSYALSQDGQRLWVTDALGKIVRYDYDAGGALIYSRTAAGVEKWMEYDDMGRKVLEKNNLAGTAVTDTEGSGSADDEVVYTNQLSWDYDIFGRLIDHNDLSGVDFDYFYDSLSGQMYRQKSDWSFTGSLVPGGREPGAPTTQVHDQSLSYYANGQLRQIDEGDGVFHRYEYDANGNRTLEESKNRDGRGLWVHTRTKATYDSMNRLVRVFSEELDPATGVATEVIANITYGYDAVGNRRVVVADTGYGYGIDSPTAPNQGPVAIGSISTRRVLANNTTIIRIRASDLFRDPEQGLLNYSASLVGLTWPAWLHLDTSEVRTTGDLILTVDATAAANYTLRLTATDTGGLTKNIDVGLHVVAGTTPVVTPGGVPTINLVTGAPFESELTAATLFSDSDTGDILTLSVVSISPVAPWLTVEAGEGGLRLRGTGGVAGTYNITVRATDLNGASVTRVVQVVVAANEAPEAVAVGEQVAVIGRTFNFELPQTSLFTDANGDTLTITAAFANGSPLPAWLSLQILNDTNPPTVRVTGFVPADAPPAFVLRFTATDSSGASVTNDVLVTTVPNAIAMVSGSVPNQTALAYLTAWSFTFPDTTFSTAGNVPLAYTATGMPTWMSFDSATRTFSGDPGVMGSWTITLTATADSGETKSVTFTVTTPNQAPVPINFANPSAEVDEPWSFQIPAFLERNTGQTLSYTITTLPPGISFNSTTLMLTGTPTTTGLYTVTMTASDGIASSSKTFSINVFDPNAQPPYVANPLASDYTVQGLEAYSYTIPVNAFVDPNNQALTYSFSGLPGWLTWNAATRTLSGTATNFNNLFEITVTVTNTSGLQVSDSFDLQVTKTMNSQSVAPANPLKGAPSLGIATITGQTLEARWDVTLTTAAVSFDLGNLDAATRNAEASWFTYDGENRTLISGGQLVNGLINLVPQSWQDGIAGSREVVYDAMGNAVVSMYVLHGQINVQRNVFNLRGQHEATFDTQVVGETWSGSITNRNFYDDGGRLLSRRHYYATPGHLTYTWQLTAGETVTSHVWAGGWLSAAETYTYDDDGRILTSTTKFRGFGNEWVKAMAEGPTPDDAQQANDLGVLSLTRQLVKYDNVFVNGVQTRGYDTAGRLVGYQYSQIQITDSLGAVMQKGFTFNYEYTYQGREGYVELEIDGTSPNNNYKATTSESIYDAAGRRVAVQEVSRISDDNDDDLITLRYFAYDGAGGILSRRDGNLEDVSGVMTFVQADEDDDANEPNEYLKNPASSLITDTEWNAMSRATREAWVAKFKNQRYAYVNGNLVARNDQAGVGFDTLTMLTGYSSSTGGTSTVVIQDGDTLRSLAQRVYGDETYWYAIAAANSIDSDESLVTGVELKVPEIKVHQNDSATFKPYDPGEIIGPTAPSLPYVPPPPKPGCGVGMILMVVVAIVVSIASYNTLTGHMGAMAAGFLSGVASSVASQVVGKAAGVIDHFSLRQAVGSGITSALTAGIGEITSLGTVAEALKAGSYAKAAGLAVASSLAGYVGNRIAGVTDTHFSWKNIAASTVGSIVSAGAGVVAEKYGSRLFQEGTFSGDLSKRFADGVVTAHTRKALGLQENVDYRMIAVDAFGNAIGNSAVRGMQVRSLDSQQRVDYDEMVKSGIAHADAVKYAIQASAPLPGYLMRAPDDYDLSTEEGLRAYVDRIMVGNSAEEGLLQIADASRDALSTDIDPQLQRLSRRLNPAGLLVSPIVITDTVDPATAPGINATVLSNAKYRLDSGDRAGAYLELYQATGQPQLLIQAQITTYTGAIGGAALMGNYLAKLANPEHYNLTLDQFSKDIVQATINLYETEGNGVTADMLQDSDRSVWASKRMADYFPGNSQYMDETLYNANARSIVNTPGARNAVDAYLFGATMGKRPSDFLNNDNYTTVAGERFSTVVDNRSGRIEAFWDSRPQLTPDIARLADWSISYAQIPDRPLSTQSFAQQFRLHAYEFLQANGPAAQLDMPQTWMRDRPVQSPHIIGDYKNGWFLAPNQQSWVRYTNAGLGPLGIVSGYSRVNASDSAALDAARSAIIQSRLSQGLPPLPLLPRRY